jgi:hypothetical protein
LPGTISVRENGRPVFTSNLPIGFLSKFHQRLVFWNGDAEGGNCCAH